LGAAGQIPDRALTIVSREGQTIKIEESDLGELSILVRDDWIDCDQEIQVLWKEQEVFKGKVSRTIAAIQESLERGDPKGAYFAKINVGK
jgi:DNA-binding winged helix-turn-helix (wHTH) protein